MLEYIVKTPSLASYKYSENPNLKEHAKIAREAGAESMVLLENNGALPMSGDAKVALFGVSSYEFISGGTGSGDVNGEYLRNVYEGLKGKGVEVEKNLAQWYAKYIDLNNTALSMNRGGPFWGKPVPDEMEGGAAVADDLTGKVNPSGKLPMTFPMSFFDNPSSLNFPFSKAISSATVGRNRAPRKDVDYTDYAEGIYVGYRFFETAGKAVPYPFGYGLSYTGFSYSDAAVKADADGFTATVKVTNTGEREGREVVELYISAPSEGMDKPATELKGFVKTKSLKPGESQTVTIKVDNYSPASFVGAESSWVAEAGEYGVKLASSLHDIRRERATDSRRPSHGRFMMSLIPKGSRIQHESKE